MGYLSQSGAGLHRGVETDSAREDRGCVSRTLPDPRPFYPAWQPARSHHRDGPLTSRQQQEKVLRYCGIAKQEGGEILTGGRTPEREDLSKGCFVEPTVVRAKPHDTVNREEVFGPFVTVSTFKDDEEAVAVANSVNYGLGSGLWTTNLSRGHKVARQIRAGMVWVNCYKVAHPASPFGGTGESGYGRDMGFEAMREYTRPKSIWVNVDAAIAPHYER